MKQLMNSIKKRQKEKSEWFIQTDSRVRGEHTSTLEKFKSPELRFNHPGIKLKTSPKKDINPTPENDYFDGNMELEKGVLKSETWLQSYWREENQEIYKSRIQ